MVSILQQRIQAILIMVVLMVGGWYMYTNRENISVMRWFLPDIPIMHLGNIPVRVEIAETLEERKKGLSGREKLQYAQGLLFIFPEADYHGIWMKDMHFPIDIIWISEDLTIIHIDEYVTPETYPRVFKPKKPARYVVETNVNFADSLGIVEGQKVRLPLIHRDE